jgi:hypothetical protein
VLHLWIAHGRAVRFVPTRHCVHHDEWDAVSGSVVVPAIPSARLSARPPARLSASPPASLSARHPVEHPGRDTATHSADRTRRLEGCARSLARHLRLVEGIACELENSRRRCTASALARAYTAAVADSHMLGIYSSLLARDHLFCNRPCEATACDMAARSFIDINGGRDLDMNAITRDAVDDFRGVLTYVDAGHEAIGLHLRTLRAIYDSALDEGLVSPPSEHPFPEHLFSERHVAEPEPEPEFEPPLGHEEEEILVTV